MPLRNNAALTSRITAFRRPLFFQDRMVKGAFKFLEHDHHFEPRNVGGQS